MNLDDWGIDVCAASCGCGRRRPGCSVVVDVGVLGVMWMWMSASWESFDRPSEKLLKEMRRAWSMDHFGSFFEEIPSY